MKNLYLFLIILFIFGCKEIESDGIVTILPVKINKEVSKPHVVLFNDTFQGKEIVLVGDANDEYIVSFGRNLLGELLEFKGITGELPVIMEDSSGSRWDIFGYAVSGAKKGQRLTPTQSLMGYWFSIATFYPGTEIYPENGKGEFDGLRIEGDAKWLVPEKEVRFGGVGKDGIPALIYPNTSMALNVSFLDDHDLVVGFSDGVDQKSYPHAVLDWHEIINDGLRDYNYAIIYCPLTGTATAWNRNIGGNLTTFGVSGLIYNSNIVPYDRASDSNWSQLFDVCIFGENKGLKPENFMILETKWKTWKKMYPHSDVVNFTTEYSRDYGRNAYGSTYASDGLLVFPVKYKDSRLHKKERVHTVIVNGNARVYRFENFTKK